MLKVKIWGAESIDWSEETKDACSPIDLLITILFISAVLSLYEWIFYLPKHFSSVITPTHNFPSSVWITLCFWFSDQSEERKPSQTAEIDPNMQHYPFSNIDLYILMFHGPEAKSQWRRSCSFLVFECGGIFFPVCHDCCDIHSLNSSCCQSKQTPHSSCGLLFPLTPPSSCPWPSASCRTLWTGSAQQTWRTVFAVKEVFSLSVWSVEQLHFASRVSHLSSAIHRRRVLTPVLKTSNKSQPVSDMIFLDTPPNVACPPASWARRPSPWRADLLFH